MKCFSAPAKSPLQRVLLFGAYMRARDRRECLREGQAQGPCRQAHRRYGDLAATKFRITTVGCVRAATSAHSTSAASNRRRCCSGERADGGYFAVSGRFKSGAISASASAGFSPTSSSRLSSCASCSSAGSSPPRQKLAKHLSNRVEGRILEKRPGRRLDPGMWSTRDLFVEALHQARFADPCLADD